MATQQFDLQGYLEAWRSKDMDRVLDFYADDITYNEPGLESPIQGKDAYRENAEAFMGAFDDLQATDVRAKVMEGNRIAWMVRGQGTHSRNLRFMDGREVPPSERSIDVMFADFMTIGNDGRITEETLVYDTGTLMKQIGALQESAPTP